MESRTESTMEKVFRLDLTFTNILKYLGVDDLKSCRLVSLDWKETSTAILQNRQEAQIKFQIEDEIPIAYYTRVKSNESKLLLKDLTALLALETTKNFPFTSFSFDRGDLCSAEMCEFLDVYGSKIKFAELGFHEPYRNPPVVTSVEAFREFLVDKAQNIEHLIIGRLPEVWSLLGENGKLFPDDVVSLPSLPSLKTLEIKYGLEEMVHLQILKDILSIAPILKKFVGFEPQYTPLIIETGKSHCVHKCSIQTRPPLSILKYYKEFANAKPTVKDLDVGFHAIDYFRQKKDSELNEMKRGQEVVKDVVTKLLFSSKRSLETLTLYPIGVLGTTLKEIEIPVLENLKTLSLYNASDLRDRLFNFCTGRRNPGNAQDELIFPIGLTNLQEIFPAVQTAKLELYTDMDDLFSIHFPGDPSDFCIPSVKLLKLSNCCTNVWLEKLSFMFPNIQRLEMKIDFEADGPSEEIWKLWPKLDYLEFSRTSPDPFRFISKGCEKVVRSWKNPEGYPKTIVELVNHYIGLNDYFAPVASEGEWPDYLEPWDS